MNAEIVHDDAGEMFDDLDKTILCLEGGAANAESHLYVARHLLLTHLEQRQHQSPAISVAGLRAVEDALQRAHDDLLNQESAVADNIEFLHQRIIELHEMYGEVESRGLTTDSGSGTRRWGLGFTVDDCENQ